MTRETRIALLVGLAFIVLFGLVLGQRSLNHSTAVATSGAPTTAARAGAPDVMVAAMVDRNEQRPALSPGGDSRPPAEPVAARSPTTAPAAVWTEPPVVEAVEAGPSPLATAAAPSAPPVAGRSYTVQQGDTLIRIARKVYGRGHESEYRRILSANKDEISSASSLSIGKVLMIPPLEASVACATTAISPSARRKADAAAGNTYMVQKGDVLGEVALKTLGSGSPNAVKRLLEANKDKINNPDLLRVGMMLKIPEG